MKTVIVSIVMLATSLVSGQAQFEQGMEKAFQLWGEGKNAEASAMFERIASAEKNNWLPNYYVALVNTTTAFQNLNDPTKVTALLDKAQQALDVEFGRQPENAEILVMQAMIYTAWVAADPMTNAMKYSARVMEMYDKAQAIDPENPRVIFGRAEFEIGGARYFGSDTTPMCNQIDKAIALFATFKPETPFHPNWGQDRALEAQKACQKK